MSTTVTEVSQRPGFPTDTNSMILFNHRSSEPTSVRNQGVPLPPPLAEAPTVLDKDRDTPDKHVRRDSRLICLTGAHPFNAEAPLTPLYDEGMDVLLSGRSLVLSL